MDVPKMFPRTFEGIVNMKMITMKSETKENQLTVKTNSLAAAVCMSCMNGLGLEADEFPEGLALVDGCCSVSTILTFSYQQLNL